MKKHWIFSLIIITISLLSIELNAQKRNNVWVMYSDQGLDFNYSPPRHFYSGLYACCEAIGAISDPVTGKLLFYSSATDVYNAANQVMPNGANLAGDRSATQGAICVPMPGGTTKYYLFVLSQTGEGPQCLSYSIIDMTLDSNLGDVVAGQKNITIVASGLSEKMQVVSKSDCSGYWLLVHQLETNCFLAYSITASGIASPVQSCVGKVYDQGNGTFPYLGAGAMAISPNGKLLAAVHYDYRDSVYSELFDFDNNTGIVSNAKKFWTGFSYGVTFSPDNSKIYVTSCMVYGQSLPVGQTVNMNYLYQFDLLQGPNIDATRYVLDSIYQTFWLMGLQRGPDNKVYVCGRYPTVINDPNNAGAACNYNSSFIFIDSTASLDSTFISSDFPNYVIEVANTNAAQNRPTTDTSVCRGTQTALLADTAGQQFYWSSGQTQNPLVVDTAGVYSVNISLGGCQKITDTFIVHELPLPDISLPRDTTLCSGGSWSINSYTAHMSVQWGNQNLTTDTFTIRAAGTYVFRFSEGTCQSNDTTTVSILDNVNWVLPSDTFICDQSLQLKMDIPDATIMWNGAISGNTFTINQPGLYWVDVTGVCGNFKDTINVVSCNPEIFIPNSFSPNGDGNNDVFAIYGSGIRSISISIFNRWGELVFESEDASATWNGMYKGKLQNPGVYVYKAGINFNDGTIVRKKGSITLLR